MDKRTPNFENLRVALLRQGEPAYVPIVELGVDYDVKCSFLGRPISTLADEVEFWARTGYDFVPFQAGIRTVFWPGIIENMAESQLHRRTHERYSVYTEEDRQILWADEGKGVISNIEEFERFPWPDPDRMDFSEFEEVKPLLPSGMKVMVNLGSIFTAAWMLMGMETFCAALSTQPQLVRRIYDRIWDIQSRTLFRILKFDIVGAVFHTDDLAHGGGPMVSPRHYRQYVFPWYRWCTAILRQHDLPHIYHSDGRLYSLLDDLLACGFDALHPVEPKAMDMAELKRNVGDRLCLIGNIDLGYTLTRGTPREVEEEVRERIRTVGPGGGYCLGSSNSVTSYVPLDNFNAMREAAFRYGNYPLSA